MDSNPSPNRSVYQRMDTIADHWHFDRGSGWKKSVAGAADAFGVVTDIAIALLFFLHGAKLSREAILAGLGNWRLHGVVLAFTFAVFPLLGLGDVRRTPPHYFNEIIVLYLGGFFIALAMALVALAVTQQGAVQLADVVLGRTQVSEGLEHEVHCLGVAGHLLLVTGVEALELEVRQQLFDLAVG